MSYVTALYSNGAQHFELQATKHSLEVISDIRAHTLYCE